MTNSKELMSMSTSELLGLTSIPTYRHDQRFHYCPASHLCTLLSIVAWLTAVVDTTKVRSYCSCSAVIAANTFSHFCAAVLVLTCYLTEWIYKDNLRFIISNLIFKIFQIPLIPISRENLTFGRVMNLTRSLIPSP